MWDAANLGCGAGFVDQRVNSRYIIHTDWLTAGCVVKCTTTSLARRHFLRLGILHENQVNYFTHIEFVCYLRMLLDGMG